VPGHEQPLKRRELGRAQLGQALEQPDDNPVGQLVVVDDRREGDRYRGRVVPPDRLGRPPAGRLRGQRDPVGPLAAYLPVDQAVSLHAGQQLRERHA